MNTLTKHRLVWWIFPLVVGVALGSISNLKTLRPGQQATDLVRTKRIELVDDAGNIRSTLEVRDNATLLTLYGGKSSTDWRTGVILAADPKGVTGLSFVDAETKSYILLGSTPDGKAKFALKGKDKKEYKVER